MSLVDPAIKAGFDRQVTGNKDPELQDVWFDFRMGMSEEGWKKASGTESVAREGERLARVRTGDGVGQKSVHRAAFLDELVKLVPDGVAKFGKRVLEVVEKGEKMEMKFQDGCVPSYSLCSVGGRDKSAANKW